MEGSILFWMLPYFPKTFETDFYEIYGIVDFANKYIGGGVLRNGCVQEEILFAIEPEAIISLFFMQVMDNNDAIGIYNTIQYSYYEGYGDTFKFIGSAIPIDKDKIKKHKIPYSKK